MPPGKHPGRATLQQPPSMPLLAPFLLLLALGSSAQSQILADFEISLQDEELVYF